MRTRIITALAALAVIAIAQSPVHSFPLGFSVVGGIGHGYYSMEALNNHIGSIAQRDRVSIDELGSGVNFRVEGRLWILNQVAVTGGYEHYWGTTAAEGTTSTLSYRVPSDVYTFGVLVAVLRLENVFNFCVGVNRCTAESVFGTNEYSARRLTEFKGSDAGYEAYAEIHTNFLNPIEVGFQLGYRGLMVETYEDKFGEVAEFEPGRKLQVDYSGAFFYLTTAIRL